ncbi:MAG TPA: large-conductance mechanosensitive channel protein MscL [Clostridiales bacterium]|nr:large-conductance mechanosensitive channel protein MscL [Clostridiales bacterium]
MPLLKEFKEFALKGNAIDMAIGVIIAGAFGKIVTSLVGDVFMPAIGFLLGGAELNNMKIVLTPATTDAAGQVVEEVAIRYGTLIQVTIDFILIALIIFLTVKVMNRLRRKKETVEEEAVPAPTEIELLAEIRDLLKKEEK